MRSIKKLLESEAKAAPIKHLDRDRVLCRQGQKLDLAYFIIEGEAVAKATTENGKEVILDHYKEGEIVNLIAIFNRGLGSPVEILTTSKLSFITLNQNLIIGNTALFFFAASQLSELLYRQTQNILLLNDGDCNSKVSRFISGYSIGDRINLTHSEIAKELFISRSQVSKALKRLEEKKQISMKSKEIQVLEKIEV